MAACVAVFVLGVLAVNGISPYWNQENLNTNEEATEEIADMTAESAVESAEDTSGMNDSAAEPSASLDIKSSYGNEINVTDINAEPVGLKVTAIYRQEECWILYQQIQNNTQNPIQFREGSYMLEVWQEDGWYVLFTKEESQIHELDPGSRYAGE